MVLFIVLFKVVLAFESMDEIQKCDHLNEGYGAVRVYGDIYIYIIQSFAFMSKLSTLLG